MRIAALIVAAGNGSRMGADRSGRAKQFQMLAGRAVVAHTVDCFSNHPLISEIIIVAPMGGVECARDALKGRTDVIYVEGGDSRSASVARGLAQIPSPITHVLIHDGARPLVAKSTIDGVIEALKTGPAAAPALAVTDALWRGADGQVTAPQARDGLYRAQTPQGFEINTIRTAHASGIAAADDVELALSLGIDVTITQGHEDNLKLTYPADFDRAERLLAMKEDPMDIRLGNGFDVHRFGTGDHVVLCGVRVPFERGLQGHSDADVGMHAVTDAIYGALAQGDIGQHFPPSDPQWKGAESHIFLRHAVELATEMGFSISNVDCTLICEFPKIGPHAANMRIVMAEIMNMEVDRVSVKATTSERLGFTGRGEGIASIATATLVKK
ncbi:bifunctional 2-C-methyl-D-erythritol 4-phosphate cytidylyltransferase/2-C-methyl-D-erythritol 2,4-cyclodiphosphate synthase [Falsihalocynthiibacter sp. BN13B15]|uniref:bifunctional 2-C-methyl-D-erythritol 4-phosphate cytidylyltransferase/2-C-methyl-D-erythritol 2,4-cyclodiphosphate synthase n=1 Tax=Falsihalocynthiibacter sp. BN13B15 TaxID=3240871 RepID=UPI003510B1E1